MTIVASGGTTGIDFALVPSRGITGVITDSAGDPLPGVAVDFWDMFGDPAGSAVTGTGGGYVFRPSPGTYFVSTDNGLGATDEVWDDIPCPLGPAHQGLCDPTAGDPVLLPDFTSLVPGIDFALSGLELFADGFESGDTSAWTSTVE